MNIDKLKEPLAEIHWRSQSISKNGNSALALAYMDARHVMDRLDSVCGPAGWQDSYTETAKGRIISTISIYIDGAWVAKSDGAGDTAVEGEKGGISDAFKRAAVKWGIGRYLYDLPTVWAECETYQKDNKNYFSKWTPNGLAKLNQIHPPPPIEYINDDQRQELQSMIDGYGFNVINICKHYKINSLKDIPLAEFINVKNAINKKYDKQQEKDAS